MTLSAFITRRAGSLGLLKAPCMGARRSIPPRQPVGSFHTHPSSRFPALSVQCQGSSPITVQRGKKPGFARVAAPSQDVLVFIWGKDFL
jgi:hypothetical protein